MKAAEPSGDSLVFDAIELAARAHAGQYRKGTRLPYLIHPLSVARILIEFGLDDAVVAAGVLHDTVEDTDVSVDEIRERFGAEVAGLVDAVSEPDRSASWEERKRRTVATIRHGSEPVVWIELADKLDNIRAISADRRRLGEAIWDRFNRPMHLQRWYYQALAEAFVERLAAGPAAELASGFAEEVRRVFGERPGAG